MYLCDIFSLCLLEALHLCGLFQVKYKEKYEKEKGKAMLDFETPTYVTAKEAQHMQSQVKTVCLLCVSNGNALYITRRFQRLLYINMYYI